MNESDLITKIKNYLKTIDDIFYWKEHGGMYGVAGIPDIIICYKGRFVAMEAKVGKNKPTILQEKIIKEIKQAGGIAEIVRSVDDAKRVMQLLA